MGDIVDSVWKKYSSKIYKLCESKCRDEDEAKDLFQTVALKFCQRAGQLEVRANLLPWLLTVTRNTYIDSLAEKNRFLPMSIVAEDTPDYNPFDETAALFFEKEPDAESRELLEKSCAVLLPLERMIIDMTYFGGMPVREMSDILGISQNAVRKRRYLALRKMHYVIADESAEIEKSA